jgi:hypothetical protein
VNRDLYALITSDVHRTLASLARAIRLAARHDHMPIWRSFVVRVSP